MKWEMKREDGGCWTFRMIYTSGVGLKSPVAIASSHRRTKLFFVQCLRAMHNWKEPDPERQLLEFAPGCDLLIGEAAAVLAMEALEKVCRGDP